MAELTKSELLFAKHCSIRGVSCTRIEEGKEKVADFLIDLGSTMAFVEVKQLDLNDNDKIARKKMESGHCAEGVAPTRRVRDQIAKAYKQLKTYSATSKPCLVVLYNNAGMLNRIDNFTVTTAMFGTFGIHIGLDPGQVIRQIGQGFGGKRKLTKNRCRGISAVCVISGTEHSDSSLTVYHNPFATSPVAPVLLASLASSQYRHESPHAGLFVQLLPGAVGV